MPAAVNIAAAVHLYMHPGKDNKDMTNTIHST